MWFNTSMLPLIVTLSGCFGGTAEPPPAPPPPREAAIPEQDSPSLDCGPGTTKESGSSEEGTQYWCSKGGVMHGQFISYHPNGERAASGWYHEDEPDGNWMWWHENGETKRKGKYRKGKQTGSWTWWHDNGERKEEGDFLQGRRQGKWTTYYENGLRESEGMYQNDMKAGTWTFFNDDGENSVSVIRTFENGEITKEETK